MTTVAGETGFSYLIELKDMQATRKSNTGLLLSILAIIIFLTRWDSANENFYIDFIIALIILAGLVYNKFFSNRKKKIPYRFFFMAAAAGLGLLYPFHFLSIAYLILAFAEAPLNRSHTVAFSNDGVLIKSWKKDFYAWPQLQSAILKDGLLTLDFKNNRILQKEISSETKISESDFNVWCAGCIHQAGFKSE
jgi:ribosomal protein S18